jgi:c-di-GMP-binding flagellar brake protein YcgR
MTVNEERRTSRRVPVQCPVKYFYLPSLNAPETRTLDLSAGGARIEAVDPLTPGASVAFQIITPEHHVVDVRAQVVHRSFEEYRPYRVGVRFTGLSAGDRAILAREILRAVA